MLARPAAPPPESDGLSRLELLEIDLVMGLSQKGPLDAAVGTVLGQGFHRICTQNLRSKHLLLWRNHQTQRITQQIPKWPWNSPEHRLVGRSAVGESAGVHREGRGDDALVELLLGGDALLIHNPLDDGAKEGITSLDLSQPVMGLGGDDIMNDAVAHVKLDHFSSELAAGVAAKLQRKTQRPIPHLLHRCQHMCWRLVVEDLGHMIRGGLARNSRTG